MLLESRPSDLPLTCILVSHLKAVLVQEAISSLQAQTFRDWETVIIDSGLLYDTGLFDRLALDSRFKVIRSPEDEHVRTNCVPHSWCVNWCYRQGLIRGEITTYLCDDDIYYPHAFETIAAAYREHPDWDAAYFPIDWASVDPDGTIHIGGRAGVGGIGGQCCNGQTMNCVVDYLQFSHRTHLLDALAPTGWPEERWAIANADGIFMERVGAHTPIYPVHTPPIAQNRRTTQSINRGDFQPPISVRPKEVPPHGGMGQLLAVMQRPPKTSLPNLRIVTAADAGYFVPLQTLLLSIVARHKANTTVIDLGLTAQQSAWCARQGVEVVTISDDALLIPRVVPFWQTWNKPVYLELYKGERVLWLDADCIVIGSLTWFDEMLQHRPVLTGCIAAKHFLGLEAGIATLRNSDELYDHYPVIKRIEEHPNAGVCAFDLSRNSDTNLLQTWLYMIGEAAYRQELLNTAQYEQGWLKWFDQGALQWAIERQGLTEILVRDRRLNDPITAAGPHTPGELVTNLKACDSKVIHFPAGGKPYGRFPNPLEVEATNDLTLLILDHRKEQLDAAAGVRSAKLIYLPDLNPDNNLAENRIFHSDIIDNCESEYIGLCTGSWNRKYKKRCRPLEQLADLPMSPRLVWAAYYTHQWWGEESETAHAGMLRLLQQLAAEWGMTIRNRSLWSNNFIAHKSVLLELAEFHRWAMPYVAELCAYRPYSTELQDGETRYLSYIAERLSMLWFATRSDLDITQIPL